MNQQININNQANQSDTNSQNVDNDVNSFQRLGIPFGPTQFFNPMQYMMMLQQSCNYYYQQYMNLLNDKQEKKETKECCEKKEEIEKSKKENSSEEHHEDLKETLLEGLPKVENEEKKVDIPNFSWIEGQRGLVPCLHGVVFHQNNGNSYHCKYGGHNGSCPVTASIRSETDWKYVEGNQFKHNHKITDYIDYMNKKKLQEIATAKGNENMTAVQIVNKAKIQNSTRRRSTNIRTAQKFKEKKQTPH